MFRIIIKVERNAHSCILIFNNNRTVTVSTCLITNRNRTEIVFNDLPYCRLKGNKQPLEICGCSIVCKLYQDPGYFVRNFLFVHLRFVRSIRNCNDNVLKNSPATLCLSRRRVAWRREIYETRNRINSAVLSYV